MKYDVFISHASEDKEAVAIPLAKILKKHKKNVWLDKFTLKVGDNLKEKIDEGLASSRYGAVIISRNFLRKDWPQKELNALVSKEKRNRKVILPIIHNLSRKELEKKAPKLADKIPTYSKNGIDAMAKDILSVLDDKTSAPQLVIGISGASCSGKTWFAKKILSKRPKSTCIFELDSYYKDYKYVSSLEYTHDNPKAIDFDAAIAALTRLKSGYEIDIPVYDFQTHKQKSTKKCKPQQIIIVDGLFAFHNKKLMEAMDIKLWLESDSTIKFTRRVIRDTEERGQTLEEVFERYAQDVEPGYEKFVMPLKERADVVFVNNAKDNNNPLMLDLLLSYLDGK